MAPANPLDYIAIQNTISRYCIALDTQDWDLLKEIFTTDVYASYPFRDPMKGVQTLVDAIKRRLSPITSQHALTTQMLEIAEEGKSAKATTYFTGIHFGKGKWQGKEVTAWGKYVDDLVVVDGNPGVPGASGKWLISRRDVVFMGRLGEEGVMQGS
ncbi:uncharacterized protein BCR38DRAFT_472526 [Pseudomassariella vexata]|uniref:SnoaL-like domain-containing protein n=1 Tax=Pseudomassariella vexata TaxID=1141098 RepID=A0A1Y2E6P4_9PEZI|nr:uncharacterized protein BCR38DRAFT_472526 [Pseudomassariella vexata]ORY67004.1 hypothetical protein BCR38DRAFT_472526 [Pseudomassariella vexata]